MILVDDEVDDIVYLVPPNQQDWHFTLTKDKNSQDTWFVSGVRDYEYIEDIKMVYVICNGSWHRKE
jgi:hypothetical protein